MSKNAVRRRQILTAESSEMSEDVNDVEEAEKENSEKSKKKEKPLEESKKKNNDLASKRLSESQKHNFTVFYNPNYPITEADLENLTHTPKTLKSYQHSDSIEFMDATWKWMNDVAPEGAELPTGPIGRMPTFTNTSGVCAFYRVISEVPGSRYILAACYQNTHGRHRGDLRFVEVNHRTKTRGIAESVIGHLFLGDILAVTELVKTEKAAFRQVNTVDVKFEENMKCQWAVRSMSVRTRNLRRNVKFAIMDNGTAVVQGQSEAMIVKTDGTPLNKDTVYLGDVFLPQKMDSDFTSDHHSNDLNRMIQMTEDFSRICPILGTVYQYTVSGPHTEMFEVGTNAFKDPRTRHNPDETVEFCALIGYSAAKTVFGALNDSRKFVMHDTKRTAGNLIRFSINNPKEHPTDGFWHSNGRVGMTSNSETNTRSGAKPYDVTAEIETIFCDGRRLNITARLSRNVPNDQKFDGLWTVQQRQPPPSSLISERFLQQMDSESNGKRIIRALYGGPKIAFPSLNFEKQQFTYPATPAIPLNEFQCEYVQKVLDGAPIVIANSPFGCGKSMTIVTAALYLFQKNKEEMWHEAGGKHQQLLVTQSNYASINLVEIALKTLGRVKDVKFLRYITEWNWKEIPDTCRTKLDMPHLMNDVFVNWATNSDPRVEFPPLKTTVMTQIVCYVLKTLHVNPCRLTSLAMGVLGEAMKSRPPWQRQLLDAFFSIYHPDIIIVTASSLPGLLNSPFISKSNITNVQIDEASQLAEYKLLSLLTLIPNARFGLIGDIQQLPPYCEEELTGKLKDYGIGNAMERAVKQELFPQVVLKCVYRCHPATTQLLGELFYSNQLIPGVTVTQRSDFMRNRRHFWPNPNFPIMVVDNKSKAQTMGTSFANDVERAIVKQIIEFLMDAAGKKYVIHPADVGIISYYSAQTSMLTDALRDVGVKCGSFQGSEREIIVLCCTNDDIQEFMKVKNRLNVAMSRSKQVTILIGNVEMLKKVDNWSTIIERCEQNGTVVDTTKYPFKVMPNAAANVNKMAKNFKKHVNLETTKRKK